MRWQHCIDHADTKQKPANVTRLSSRRSSAADRQSVKRDQFCLCAMGDKHVHSDLKRPISEFLFWSRWRTCNTEIERIPTSDVIGYTLYLYPRLDAETCASHSLGMPDASMMQIIKFSLN